MKISKQPFKFAKLDLVLFLIALIVGLFLRLYKIDIIPYGTNHDGAWSAIWATELSLKPFPIQIYSQYGWLGEAMPRYIMAIFIKLFGPTIYSERIGMTIFTIFALPALYYLAKLLFNNHLLAFFSTFLLATSGWDITYAKSGWRTSALPFFEILTIYFLVKALKSRKTRSFLFTGIFLALTLNTYNASQFMPLTVFTVLGIYLITKKERFSEKIKNIAIAFFAFIIVVSPLAFYAVNHWANFTERNQSLFLGNRIKTGQSLTPLWENLTKISQMYNIHGGGDDFFIKEPLLDFPTNYLFMLGLIIGILKIRQKKFAFLFFWFITALIPSFLGTPNGSHAIGTLPIVYIFAGIALYEIYFELRKIKPLLKIYLPQLTVTFLLMAAFLTTFNLYLGPKRRELWGFYPETTIVGNYMKPRIPSTDFYLTDNYPRDALTYLTYQDGDPWIKHYTWFEDTLLFLNIIPNSNKNTSFIMFKTPSNQFYIDSLKQKFPQGHIQELIYKDDNIKRPAAWVFTVPSYLN